jgi:SAM-dependent methyltransferase
MGIDYNHSQNAHTLAGPQAALPALFADYKPSSLLDVGCGTGTWLKAAIDFGIQDVFGIDGIPIPPNQLLVPAGKFRQQDIAVSWDLGRRFDAALCLEVAEHLEAAQAPILMDALVQHTDVIFFSAACPGQRGQHHVNCQWPEYWQKLFNARGYACFDDLRWRIWEDERVEPWYRQNVFVARRDPVKAGKEPRIPAVVHPAICDLMVREGVRAEFPNHVRAIEQGGMPKEWYLVAPIRALATKVYRRIFSSS